jgi:hypothetical protein
MYLVQDIVLPHIYKIIKLAICLIRRFTSQCRYPMIAGVYPYIALEASQTLNLTAERCQRIVGLEHVSEI